CAPGADGSSAAGGPRPSTVSPAMPPMTSSATWCWPNPKRAPRPRRPGGENVAASMRARRGGNARRDRPLTTRAYLNTLAWRVLDLTTDKQYLRGQAEIRVGRGQGRAEPGRPWRHLRHGDRGLRRSLRHRIAG